MNDLEKMYLENEKLAYKFCTQYGLLNDEDMVQNIKMALWRAIKSYNSNKNIQLSTYAFRVMSNEYMYSFRNKNRKLQYVSNIVTDEEGKEESIFEFIVDNTKDLDTEIINKDIVEKIYSYLDTIDEDSKNLYIDYYINNIKQIELSKIHGLSQAQISRKIKAINKNLQYILKSYL